MKKLHVIFILALVLVTANMAESFAFTPKKPGKHKSAKKSKKKKSGYYFNFQH
ncbi:hypothetical protein [Sporocytophaga myxococcoides]|uniref:hypothetical protein n=1 Tax=Sporocytophaga myxococcoides TaxID=153721 RepID=UPI00041155AA|nr:hypothetical protein [Sporocytophaga myxococcoides]